MRIISSGFKQGEKIPEKYTCEGQDISPPLAFEDVPDHAKSLVLIVDDPDVPAYISAEQNWDHWILFNIDPYVRQIAENQTVGKRGKSSSGRLGYEGPCPPDREHRYFFRLFALDTMLDVDEGITKKELLLKINGHVIAIAELMGRYEKKQK